MNREIVRSMKGSGSFLSSTIHTIHIQKYPDANAVEVEFEVKVEFEVEVEMNILNFKYQMSLHLTLNYFTLGTETVHVRFCKYRLKMM